MFNIKAFIFIGLQDDRGREMEKIFALFQCPNRGATEDDPRSARSDPRSLSGDGNGSNTHGHDHVAVAA